MNRPSNNQRLASPPLRRRAWPARTALAVGLWAALGVARPAYAQPAPSGGSGAREVTGEVLVIVASEQPGEIDPELASVPALRQPPFHAYRSMQLVMRPTIRLTVGQPHTLMLPNGRLLRLELDSITPEGRFRVRVSINRPDRQDYLPLLDVVAPPGDPFFLAGQSYLGGTLVLGVRLGERPAR